jgi:dTDP-4-dehydrorhamnose 3,5-epimerase
MSLSATALDIPDVLLLEPELFTDERGIFFEVWNQADFVAATGCREQFVQDNQSRSRCGVLRGLHYQLPWPQGKLVRVATGRAFMVAADLRQRSATFGRAVTAELSEDNHRQLWIPSGFAHGFLSLSDPTDVLYKVTEYFSLECDRELRWNDPTLGIEWPPLGRDPIMSLRDRHAPLLADALVYE